MQSLLCLLNTAVGCIVASSHSWLLRMQVEDFYFSSAAGRARIVLGNRRWGENGYVASGRQQGRPVQRTASKVKLPALCFSQEEKLFACSEHNGSLLRQQPGADLCSHLNAAAVCDHITSSRLSY